MSTKPSIDELFERRHTFPDPYAQQRLARLVGQDDKISRLKKALGLLVNSAGLDAWERKHHPGSKALMDLLRARPPLVILAGDVGSGKTELAEIDLATPLRARKTSTSLCCRSACHRAVRAGLVK